MAKLSRKRISVSKNRKKSWRKFTKIDEIEEHLDTKRQEEIHGGPINEKPNESLFFVDKVADQERISSKPGRLHWSERPLRCFQILKSDSKVQPLRMHVQIRQKKAINRPEGNTKSEKDETPENDSSKMSDFGFDLWNARKAEAKNEQHLDEELVDYYERQTKKKGRKVPEFHFVKKSLLPAVEVPLPGTSYNPTYDDHQEILSMAHKVEMDKIKDEKRLKRALDSFFPSASEAPNEKSWMHEMSQGIFEEDDLNDDAIADGPLSVNPPVRADKRKPPNRRRKEKRLKIVAREERRKKMETIKATEVYRIRSLKAEIVSQQQKSEVKQGRKQEKEMKKMYLPRCLSRYKYEAPDIELNLSSELSGSLRTAKPDGNLLVDRFKSMQRRNIIEARIKQGKKKKAKYVKYERKTADERM